MFENDRKCTTNHVSDIGKYNIYLRLGIFDTSIPNQLF